MRLNLSILLGLAVWSVAAAISYADPASEKDRRIALFAGQITFNDYGTIAYNPSDIDWADSHFLGVAYSEKLYDVTSRVSLGWEAQLVGHTGINEHTELNIPFWIRYRAVEPVVPFQGAAFGLGGSFASSPPELEIERKGQSQRALPYWFMELEFGKPSWAIAPFLRIHHRSDGFIFTDFDTGSNAVAAGLRHKF